MAWKGSQGCSPTIRQVFHVAYVLIKFANSSARPLGAGAVHRLGHTLPAWQYFACESPRNEAARGDTLGEWAASIVLLRPLDTGSPSHRLGGPGCGVHIPEGRWGSVPCVPDMALLGPSLVRMDWPYAPATPEVAKATNPAAPSGGFMELLYSLVSPCHATLTSHVHAAPIGWSWNLCPFQAPKPKSECRAALGGQSGWVPQGWDWGGTHKGTLLQRERQRPGRSAPQRLGKFRASGQAPLGPDAPSGGSCDVLTLLFTKPPRVGRHPAFRLMLPPG